MGKLMGIIFGSGSSRNRGDSDGVTRGSGSSHYGVVSGGGGGGETPSGDHYAYTPLGWHDYPAVGGERMVYVSSSEGNDSNDGLTPSTPKASLYAAYNLMRNGYPDRLHLKRGDTWSAALGNDLGGWRLRGPDLVTPMVITTYGTGARPRVSADWCMNVEIHKGAGYLFVEGIHFDGGDAASSVGVRCVGGTGGYCIFQDCKFEGMKYGVSLDTYDGALTDWEFRRCLFLDCHSHSTGTKAQGIYTGKVDNVKLIENVFDHNGWHESHTGADRTIYNHNVYLQHGTGHQIIGNVFANGCSFGLKFSSDTELGMTNVLVRDNLLYGNGNMLTIGHSTSSSASTYAFQNFDILRNVAEHTGATIAGNDQHFGIYMTQASQMLVQENYMLRTNPVPSAGHAAFEVNSESGGAELSDTIDVINNLAYQWEHSYPSAFVQQAYGTITNVTMTGNREDPADVTMVDPSRTTAGYAAHVSVGSTAADYLTACRALSREAWNDDLLGGKAAAWIASGYVEA